MRWKKEGSCINIENEVDAWSRKTGAHASLFRKRRAVSPSDPRDVVPRDEGTRVSGERSTTSAQPEAHLRPAPRLVCNSKAGKSKTGAARGQSLFYLHLQSCGSAGLFRCLYSCSYAGFLPFVKPYFTRV